MVVQVLDDDWQFIPKFRDHAVALIGSVEDDVGNIFFYRDIEAFISHGVVPYLSVMTMKPNRVGSTAKVLHNSSRGCGARIHHASLTVVHVSGKQQLRLLRQEGVDVAVHDTIAFLDEISGQLLSPRIGAKCLSYPVINRLRTARSIYCSARVGAMTFTSLVVPRRMSSMAYPC